jgi:hypothetical protein
MQPHMRRAAWVPALLFIFLAWQGGVALSRGHTSPQRKMGRHHNRLPSSSSWLPESPVRTDVEPSPQRTSSPFRLVHGTSQTAARVALRDRIRPTVCWQLPTGRLLHHAVRRVPADDRPG